MSRYTLIAVGSLLAVMLTVQVSTAVRESQTWDEAVHLSAGLSYWKTGDFRMNPEHPPLVKLLAAVPLLFTRTALPLADASWNEVDEWRFGEVFLYENQLSPETILFLGRLPIMLLSVLLGILIFKVSYQMFGAVGGLLSLSLYAFDPNIIAHSRYVTTDMGFTLAAFLTLVALHRVFEKPNRRSATFFGLAFLAAGLSKFSGMAFLLVLVGLFILLKIKEPRHPAVAWKNVWRFVVCFIPIAWLLTWSVYAFDIRSPDADPRIAKLQLERTELLASTPVEDMPTIQRFAVETLGDSSHGIGAWLEHMKHGSYPTYTFFRGLTAVISHATGGHGSFLLGQVSQTGWWWYFPVVFIAKTPIPTLVALIGTLLVTGLLMRARRSASGSWLEAYRSLDRRWVIFSGMGLGFLAIAMAGNLNLGWRHIMPIYPAIFVMAGVLGTLRLPGPSWRTFAIPVLLTVNIAAVQLGTYPNELGYFSPIVGGNYNGPNVLQDSNLDWGQDLIKLREYVKEKNIAQLPFAYFGRARVSSFVPQAIDLPTTSAVATSGVPTGTIAISVGRLYDFQGDFRWLWPYQPVERVGSSIFIYQL